ncbi:putative transcriptional regulator [Clostridium sp. CAG:967]|nr:putative transcriptional regulator [Clostridium sp. CAG:967]
MNSKLYNKIGLKIKIERVKRNISQEKLAELADLSRPTIGAIERGQKSPTFNTLEAIADAFGMTVQELCNFDNI